MSARIADRCVDRCTKSKSNRPNTLLSVLDGRALMTVRQRSIQFADIAAIYFLISIAIPFVRVMCPKRSS
jgi:hypothetical protein